MADGDALWLNEISVLGNPTSPAEGHNGRTTIETDAKSYVFTARPTKGGAGTKREYTPCPVNYHKGVSKCHVFGMKRDCITSMRCVGWKSCQEY